MVAVKDLPRGTAQIPLWWMEITPHDILDLDEEDVKREQQYQEAVYFAQLAARDDYQQQYGGGEDYDPEKHGPRGGPGGSGGWGGGGGYQRGPGGGPGGGGPAALHGRRFKPGETPEGYTPGGYYDPSRFMPGAVGSRPVGALGAGAGANYPTAPGAAALNHAMYARDASVGWERPDWLKVKLRPTNTGTAIRSGSLTQNPSTLPDTPSRPIPSGRTSAMNDADADKDDAPAEETPGEEEEKQESGPGIGKLVKRIRRKKVKKKPANKEGDAGREWKPKKVVKKEPAWAKAMRPGADSNTIEASGKAKPSVPPKPRSAPPPKPKPASTSSDTPAAEEAEEVQEEEYFEEEEEVEEEYVDEDDEEYIEEYESEYEDEEFEEEIIVEDEEGNEIVE